MSKYDNYDDLKRKLLSNRNSDIISKYKPSQLTDLGEQIDKKLKKMMVNKYSKNNSVNSIYLYQEYMNRQSIMKNKIIKCLLHY